MMVHEAKEMVMMGMKLPETSLLFGPARERCLETNHGFSHRVYVTSRELMYGLDSSGYTPSNKFESLPNFSSN